MSTNNLFKLILAGTILAPVTFAGVGDANAQKFVTRQHIINGLQIQNPKQRKSIRKKRRVQQVTIQQAPQQQRVVKRRAPTRQKFRAPPANNGQVAVRRAPKPGNKQFRAPPSQNNVVMRRAPSRSHNPQQFRAPKQNSNIARSRAPNRNPQHFNSQVASSANINNERAIRLDQKVASYYENAASVDLEILFEYNSAKINPDSVRQLFALGEALLDTSLDGSRILIAGHTDAAGSNQYNNDLSFRRAQSVSDFLINYAGIPSNRLAIEGYGENLLKYPDAPNSGQNRRVEIINLGS